MLRDADAKIDYGESWAVEKSKTSKRIAALTWQVVDRELRKIAGQRPRGREWRRNRPE
jgi:hypothetical protein